jgi:hypothetical protein
MELDALEPACWSWGAPPTADEYRTRLESGTGNERLSASTIRRIMSAWGEAQFDEFHRDRCAICGIVRRDLVDDHDHETGMRRGWLCRSCNTREGASGHDVFEMYRQRNPATILGLRLPYTGYGWVDGVPVGGWRKPDSGENVLAGLL